MVPEYRLNEIVAKSAVCKELQLKLKAACECEENNLTSVSQKSGRYHYPIPILEFVKKTEEVEMLYKSLF